MNVYNFYGSISGNIYGYIDDDGCQNGDESACDPILILDSESEDEPKYVPLPVREATPVVSLPPQPSIKSPKPHIKPPQPHIKPPQPPIKPPQPPIKQPHVIEKPLIVQPVQPKPKAPRISIIGLPFRLDDD